MQAGVGHLECRVTESALKLFHDKVDAEARMVPNTEALNQEASRVGVLAVAGSRRQGRAVAQEAVGVTMKVCMVSLPQGSAACCGADHRRLKVGLDRVQQRFVE